MSEETDEKIIKFPDGDAARFVAKARSILERSTATSWEFADLLAGPDAPEGIGDGVLAEQLGVSRRHIGEYRAVARAWPEAERAASLSFTHHLAAHRLPKNERRQLIARAAEDGWCVNDIRAAARQAASDGKLAAGREQVRSLKRQLEADHMISMMDEGLTGEIIECLHGNMRSGIARDLRRTAERMMVRMRALIDRIDGKANTLEGHG